MNAIVFGLIVAVPAAAIAVWMTLTNEGYVPDEPNPGEPEWDEVEYIKGRLRGVGYNEWEIDEALFRAGLGPSGNAN